MSIEFDKLLGDLETLAKALPKGDELDDEKIEAAKKDGASNEEKKEGDVDVNKEVKDSDKKKPLAKSMTLADGTTVEYVDGEELVKSLSDSLGALAKRIDATDTGFSKTLEATVSLLKSQNDAIAAIRAKVDAIGDTGRGRKAVVTLVDKTTTELAKSDKGINPNEFMAKAEAGFKLGRVTGAEISFIESAYNNAKFDILPPSLVNKVMVAAS